MSAGAPNASSPTPSSPSPVGSNQSQPGANNQGKKEKIDASWKALLNKFGNSPWRTEYDAARQSAGMASPPAAQSKLEEADPLLQRLGVPSVNQIMTKALLSVGKQAWATVSIFIYITVVVSTITSTDDAGVSDYYVLNQLFVTLGPLVLFVFCAMQRVEYACREAVFFELLRHGVIVVYPEIPCVLYLIPRTRVAYLIVFLALYSGGMLYWYAKQGVIPGITFVAVIKVLGDFYGFISYLKDDVYTFRDSLLPVSQIMEDASTDLKNGNVHTVNPLLAQPGVSSRGAGAAQTSQRGSSQQSTVQNPILYLDSCMVISEVDLSWILANQGIDFASGLAPAASALFFSRHKLSHVKNHLSSLAPGVIRTIQDVQAGISNALLAKFSFWGYLALWKKDHPEGERLEYVYKRAAWLTGIAVAAIFAVQLYGLHKSQAPDVCETNICAAYGLVVGCVTDCGEGSFANSTCWACSDPTFSPVAPGLPC